MVFCRALSVVLVATCVASSRQLHHQKREATISICDQAYDSTSKIQCFCIQDGKHTAGVVSAECHLTVDTKEDDPQWEGFQMLRHSNRVVFSMARNVALTYVPSKAISHLDDVQRLEIKYGKIHEINAFAFENLNAVEITLSNDRILKLHKNGFTNMKYLSTINLDKNELQEINRDVFVNLPSLSKLYLTSNKITTIHDRAFQHLLNLKELELDNNSVFSLNNETFAGLRNLQRLELSRNALEVIGDNTFAPLVNLQYLNLGGNKIQMLDSGAFSGLARLQQLSLALNQLAALEQPGLLAGLPALTSLNIRANKLRVLKYAVMEPILKNFYGSTSQFEFQDNEFPCNCDLDWFLSLRNHTENESLKLAIENLNCYPDAKLSEAWKKLNENDKNNGEVFDDGLAPQNETNDYEYYDESQLDGKLFYIDVKDLLLCDKSAQPADNSDSVSAMSTSRASGPPPTHPPTPPKATVSAAPTMHPTTTLKPVNVPQYKTTKIINRGVLDLADNEPETLQSPKSAEMEAAHEKKHYTTSRVVTVSAKPEHHDKHYEDREMASDEAMSDKLKAHRSVHEDTLPKQATSPKHNSASTNRSVFVLILSLDIIRRCLHNL